MLVVEYRDVEVDYCLSCRGIWFDSGELRRALREFAGEDVKIVNEVLSFLKETLPREHKKEGSDP